mgnify:CR=1 FL=1
MLWIDIVPELVVIPQNVDSQEPKKIPFSHIFIILVTCLHIHKIHIYRHVDTAKIGMRFAVCISAMAIFSHFVSCCGWI